MGFMRLSKKERADLASIKQGEHLAKQDQAHFEGEGAVHNTQVTLYVAMSNDMLLQAGYLRSMHAWTEKRAVALEGSPEGVSQDDMVARIQQAWADQDSLANLDWEHKQ